MNNRFDESTGKIITVPVEKTKPDTAAFLARLEADAQMKEEKRKKREMSSSNTHSFGSKSSLNSYSDNYSNTSSY